MFSIDQQFEESKEYLKVTCTKYASTLHKQRTLDEVVQFIKNGVVNKVLFDIRESLSVMSDDDHEICGYLLAERAGYFTDCKVAFLTNDREAVLFLSYAYANGFTTFVELDSCDEALMWFSGDMR